MSRLIDTAAKHDISIFSNAANADCLHMDVKPGSKARNMVPFALKVFKATSDQQVTWWSLHGATAKTVAFAESFKSAYLNASNVEKVHQINRIYYQERTFHIPDTGIQYTCEEPGIAILLSRVPLPNQEISSTQNNVKAAFPAADTPNEKPPSRRRLEHTKKRKRKIVTIPRETEKTSFSDEYNFPSSFERQTESIDSNSDDSLAIASASLANQCERFAPAVKSVQMAFRSELQSRKKHKKIRTK